MIQTQDELRKWLDEAPNRHRLVNGGACSCGWGKDDPDVLEFALWEDHYEAMWLVDLPYVIPGNTTKADGGPESCGETCDKLYELLDGRDEEIAGMEDDLQELAFLLHDTTDDATLRATAVEALRRWVGEDILKANRMGEFKHWQMDEPGPVGSLDGTPVSWSPA